MKLRDFFQNKSWKKWDKSQWAILVLAGVLMMVVAIPTGEKEDLKTEEKEETQILEQHPQENEDYVRKLEKKLEKTLSKIDGAGEVEVMITLEDSGESIVEKDTQNETTNLNETDSAGGNRTEKDTRMTHTTVFSEYDSQKTPFIGKEMTPKISGVLIVARGGDDTAVKQNISDAVMALFQIDVNRIKVVKMNIQEEEY